MVNCSSKNLKGLKQENLLLTDPEEVDSKHRGAKWGEQHREQHRVVGPGSHGFLRIGG